MCCHKNPVTDEYEEKHLKPAPMLTSGKDTMLYTLIVIPDQTTKKSQAVLQLNPSVNLLAEIDDAQDNRPANWVNGAKVSDHDAKKPGDWDEDAPYTIPDEDTVNPMTSSKRKLSSFLIPKKPEEWDDEEDGDWIPPTAKNPKYEAATGCGPWKRCAVSCGPFLTVSRPLHRFSPTKPNPNYKGKWLAPLIDNPAYKGLWTPRRTHNPGFFEDKTPAQSVHEICSVVIELWKMAEDFLFSNTYVGHFAADPRPRTQGEKGIRGRRRRS